MIVDRLGIRPAPSKIDAITQLSTPNTVEEVRVLLGMTGYLQHSGGAHFRFCKRCKVQNQESEQRETSWGEEQNKAFNALIEAFDVTSNSSLAGVDRTVLAVHRFQRESRSGANAMHRRSGEGDRVRQ